MQTPGCYYGEKDPATGNTILLLEDMNHARQGDSVAGCTQDAARACVEQLARFQAKWWDCPRLGRLAWLPLRNDETDTYEEMYAGRLAVTSSEGPVAQCPPGCKTWATAWRQKFAR